MWPRCGNERVGLATILTTTTMTPTAAATATASAPATNTTTTARAHRNTGGLIIFATVSSAQTTQKHANPHSPAKFATFSPHNRTTTAAHKARPVSAKKGPWHLEGFYKFTHRIATRLLGLAVV